MGPDTGTGSANSKSGQIYSTKQGQYEILQLEPIPEECSPSQLSVGHISQCKFLKTNISPSSTWIDEGGSHGLDLLEVHPTSTRTMGFKPMQTLKCRIFRESLGPCKGDGSPPPLTPSRTVQEIKSPQIPKVMLTRITDSRFDEVVVVPRSEYEKDDYLRKLSPKRSVSKSKRNIPKKERPRHYTNEFIPFDSYSDANTYNRYTSRDGRDGANSKSRSRMEGSRGELGNLERPKSARRMPSHTAKSSTVNWSVTYSYSSVKENDVEDDERRSNDFQRIETNVEPRFNIKELSAENQAFLRNLELEREHLNDPLDQKSRIRLKFITTQPQDEIV